MQIRSSQISNKRSLPILTSSLSDSSSARHRCSKYLFLWTSSIDRADNPWRLPYRHVSLHTVSSFTSVVKRMFLLVYTYINTRIYPRIHISMQPQKCPTRGKPKRPFLQWPFSELTMLIDRSEFQYKMLEFTSSGRQSKICFRLDTRGFLLLYGWLPPMQCRRAIRYITRT